MVDYEIGERIYQQLTIFDGCSAFVVVKKDAQGLYVIEQKGVDKKMNLSSQPLPHSGTIYYDAANNKINLAFLSNYVALHKPELDFIERVIKERYAANDNSLFNFIQICLSETHTLGYQWLSIITSSACTQEEWHVVALLNMIGASYIPVIIILIMNLIL